MRKGAQLRPFAWWQLYGMLSRPRPSFSTHTVRAEETVDCQDNGSSAAIYEKLSGEGIEAAEQGTLEWRRPDP